MLKALKQLFNPSHIWEVAQGDCVVGYVQAPKAKALAHAQAQGGSIRPLSPSTHYNLVMSNLVEIN